MAETSYDSKPYAFVPFVKKVTQKRPDDSSKALKLENDEGLCGRLNVTLVAKTPLHFGAGDLDEELTNLLLREQDKIMLPGSSFKGMLRSVFEAVTESCILNYPRAPLNAKPQSHSKVCKAKGYICPACSLFGCLGYRGKLGFTSFVTKEDGHEPIKLKLPQLQTPFRNYPRHGPFATKWGEGNERLYYGDFDDLHGLDVARLSKSEFFARKEQGGNSRKEFYGRKFYKHSLQFSRVSKMAGKDMYECLPIDSELVGVISYQGLTSDEFGALLFALGFGWEPSIYYKIGYAKPAYLGSVSLQVKHAAPPERYRWKNYTKDELDELAREYLTKHKESIGAAVDALQNLWSTIGDDCWPKNPETQRLGY
jgi:hypothetical protein